MRLRRGAAADVSEVARIWNEGWREAHLGRVPDELVAHRRLEDHRERVPTLLPGMTVAEVDGEVAGFVVAVGDEVEQLFVDPGFRGGEVAGALLAAAEEEIGRRHDRARLAVVAENSRARRFYERSGWHDAGSFENLAWTPSGEPIPAPCRRYEKEL